MNHRTGGRGGGRTHTNLK